MIAPLLYAPAHDVESALPLSQTVARVMKPALVAPGKSPEQVAAFAGHSLRV